MVHGRVRRVVSIYARWTVDAEKPSDFRLLILITSTADIAREKTLDIIGDFDASKLKHVETHVSTTPGEQTSKIRLLD